MLRRSIVGSFYSQEENEARALSCPTGLRPDSIARRSAHEFSFECSDLIGEAVGLNTCSYGLKQASQEFFKLLASTVIDFGFEQCLILVYFGSCTLAIGAQAKLFSGLMWTTPWS